MNNRETKKSKRAKISRKTNQAKRICLVALKEKYPNRTMSFGIAHKDIGQMLVDSGLMVTDHMQIGKGEGIRLMTKFADNNPQIKWSKKRRKKVTYKKQSEDFLSSWEWTTLRYKVLQKHGRRCMCCGASPDDRKTVICVDHIKPRHTHPHLSLEENNLQVLCHDCNKGKGAWDETDFRHEADEDEFQRILAMQAVENQ